MAEIIDITDQVRPKNDVSTEVQGTPQPIELVITFDPADNQIRLRVPEGIDPLLTFQLLNQITQAQIPGFCQEVMASRQPAPSPLVLARPGDINPAAGVATSLRRFRGDANS